MRRFISRRNSLLAGGAVIGALAAASAHSAASAADAIRVLGFEAPVDWTITGGQIVGSSTTRTQGNSALEVRTNGYTVLTSRLLGPLGAVSPKISFDLRLPAPQPNAFWYGAAQVFVSAPSLGIYNAYVGQRELTGLPLNAFNTLQFVLPDDLHAKLQGNYADLTFSIVLNVPSGVAGTYLLDNLAVSSTIPDISTISEPDLPRILGMESASDWTITSGSIVGTSFENKTQGNQSLAIQPQGYATLTSLPMTSISPVDPSIKLDIRLPSQQPNPSWLGAVQLFVSLPSSGLNNAFLGQKELTGLSLEQFHTLEFPVPDSIRAALNGATYSDLRLSIALNVPTPGAGVYYIDNIQVGPVTTPTTETFTDYRIDLAGRASSGTVSLNVEGHNASPAVQDALIYVRSDDGNCVPSATQVCRFVVTQTRLLLGGFTLAGDSFSSALVRNLNPFRITLGGSHGLTTKVPATSKFYTLFGSNLLTVNATNLDFTINPGGSGMISVSGQLSGSLDGHNFSVGMSVTANTPLENRMPVANAGPDQTVTGGSSCIATATLDGSGTQDPDGNLKRITWLTNGTVFSGVGTTVQIPFNRPGPHLITALAEDAFGAQSRDEAQVTVQLPASCPH